MAPVLRMTGVALALVLILAAAMASPAVAAPGQLDTAFGGDGKVTTNFSGSFDGASAVAIQGDGKIVAAGVAGANTRFALVRYNPNGTLDTTFSGDGKATTNFTPGVDFATGVAIQTNGKIVAVGEADGSGGRFALVRYNQNGTRDMTFGGDGRITTNFGPSYDQASGVVIQPDGKIVAGGFSNDRFAVARYNQNGTLDSTFSGDGKATTTFTKGALGLAVALQPDDKIVVAGFNRLSLNTRFALARYNANGTLDTTFGGDGRVTTNFTKGFDDADGVVVVAGGKIVAAGGAGGGEGEDVFDTTFALARYNSDGTLDPTFSGDGKVRTNLSRGEDIALAVAVQSGGRVVAAGFARGRGARFGLARYLPNGALDPTFGAGGKVTTNFSKGRDGALGVAVQTDGKIVAAGNGTGDFMVARYNPNGTLDGTFGSGGKITTDFGMTDNPWDVAVQSDGRIVVAGNTYGAYPVSDFALARYKADPDFLNWAANPSADFDGDHKTDLGGLYRGRSPQDALWYAPSSSGGGPFQIYFGATSDIPVPGDYNGDGKTDAAIFRPSTGLWYGPGTGLAQIVIQQIVGQAGDIPIPGDYDGDGKTDPAIYRPSTGMFFAVLSSGGVKSQTFGAPGDVPVPRDYDGDGKTDFAVYRADATPDHLGLWYAPLSGGGVYQIYFGAPGDIPVPGDYNGDKRAEAVIFRESTGLWYGPYNGAPGVFQLLLGGPGDVPIPGYYDANLAVDPAIYRKATGLWFALLSGGGTARIDGLGLPTDVPVQKRPTLTGGT